MKKTGQVAHSANVYADKWQMTNDKWQMKREATEKGGGGKRVLLLHLDGVLVHPLA